MKSNTFKISILLIFIFNFSFSQKDETLKYIKELGGLQITETLVNFDELGRFNNSTNSELRSLYSEYWDAKLNSSANFLGNKRISYVKNIPCNFSNINKNLSIGEIDTGFVLGVRANLPVSDYHAHIRVQPQFIIPNYGGDDGKLFLQKGMLDDIGPIKNI